MSRNLLVLFLSLVLVVAACKDNPAPAEENGKITGRVLDFETNQVISGAYITTNPASESVQSDGSGTFKILSAAPGVYKVNASKQGYNSSYTTVTVQKGITVQAIILLKAIDSSNAAPNKPQLLLPLNNASIDNNTINLSWTCTDPDGDALVYTVLIGQDQNSMVTAGDKTSQTQFQLTNLENEKQYFWAIVAEDPSGATTSSEVRQFTVQGTSTGGGIKAYFPFNGNANDAGPQNYSTTAHDITYGDGRKGEYQGSIYFNGYTSYVGVNTPGLLDFSDDFTICCWIKPDLNNCTDYGGHVDIVSRMGCNPYKGYFGLNKGQFLEYWVFDNSDITHFYSPENTIQDEQWQHVAVVVKRQSTSVSKASFYINGSFFGNEDMKTFQKNSSCAVFIGKRFDNETFYSGYIDDLYIIDKALSQTEINQLANN